MPGVLFLSGALFALSAPIYKLFLAFSRRGGHITLESFTGLISSLRGTPGTLWFFVFVGIFLLTYVLGHLFFRRDPKFPDRKSFRKLLYGEICDFMTEIVFKQKNGKFGKLIKNKNIRINKFAKAVVVLSHHLGIRSLLLLLVKLTPETRQKIAESLKDFMAENYGAETEEKCEFPYPNLHNYLEKRGLKHLKRFVVWQKKKEQDRRSKVYVNVLKIRLSQFFPEQCRLIIRNEAHVRLASSAWYVANTLSLISVIGILILVCSIVAHSMFSQSYDLQAFFQCHFLASLFPFSILLITINGRSKINTFLHYQRMREVIFVLETAYTAFRSKDPSLLTPPFDGIYDEEKDKDKDK